MDFMGNTTFIIFIVMVLLSRYVNSEAVKKLSVEKKAALFDGFGAFSVWAIVPLLVMIGGFYFAIDYIKEHHMLYLTLFLAILGLYVVAIQVYIYKKLQKMDYPLSYIKQYLFSVLLRFVGLFVLLYPIVVSMLEV